MLVSLGTNQSISAGASQIFTYSPNSVQKIFVKVDDTGDGKGYEHSINVQLGSLTLVNTASAWGMRGYSILTGGCDSTTYDTEFQYQIDLGSHQCSEPNQNLYVTVTNTDATSTLDAVDVSALINSSGSIPIRYTEYSNSTFVQENCLGAIAYSSTVGTGVDEVTDSIELRTNISASSPVFASGSAWYANSATSHRANASQYARLVSNSVPLNTSFNYTSSTVDRILCTSLMGSSQSERRQSRNIANLQVSQAGK